MGKRNQGRQSDEELAQPTPDEQPGGDSGAQTDGAPEQLEEPPEGASDSSGDPQPPPAPPEQPLQSAPVRPGHVRCLSLQQVIWQGVVREAGTELTLPEPYANRLLRLNCIKKL